MARVVISGGSGAGKTSVIEALQRRGEVVVPEVAIRILQQLNERCGIEGQIAWRTANATRFQRAVSRRQARAERRLAGGETDVFLDRSILDGIAYCRFRQTELPDDLIAASASTAYEFVFLLDTLPDVPDRADTGRTSTRADAALQHRLLDEVYREHGYEPIPVPVMDVDARVAFIVETVRPR